MVRDHDDSPLSSMYIILISSIALLTQEPREWRVNVRLLNKWICRHKKEPQLRRCRNGCSFVSFDKSLWKFRCLEMPNKQFWVQRLIAILPLTTTHQTRSCMSINRFIVLLSPASPCFFPYLLQPINCQSYLYCYFIVATFFCYTREDADAFRTLFLLEFSLSPLFLAI